MENSILIVLFGLAILFIPIVFTNFVKKYYINKDEERKEY